MAGKGQFGVENDSKMLLLANAFNRSIFKEYGWVVSWASFLGKDYLDSLLIRV